MRVDIKSNNCVTGEDLKHVINNLNKEFEHLGIKVKNMTMYVRFQNEEGEVVEPLKNNAEVRKEIIIKKTVNADKE